MLGLINKLAAEQNNIIMRTAIIYILAFLASGFGLTLQAQKTAIMQAKVEIVSGAGFTSVKAPVIAFNKATVNNLTVEAGEFSLVAAPGTDVNIQVSQHSNTLNAPHVFESLQVDRTSNSKGEHHVSVSGILNNTKDAKELSGGGITAVIEYL